MGKRIISQHRGRGGPRYKAPSHNYLGKITHRTYDSKEKSEIMKGKIVDIVDCVGHSAPIAMVEFEDGERTFTIACDRMYVGQEISSGFKSDAEKGNTLPLKNIPEGTIIYNIEGHPGDLGKYVKTAGGSARVDNKSDKRVLVRMPSKKNKA